MTTASTIATNESDELTEASDEKSKSESELRKILPSEETFEKISVQLLDALIKRGQMEMAKGAFRTQLEVLRKVQPEQVNEFTSKQCLYISIA